VNFRPAIPKISARQELRTTAVGSSVEIAEIFLDDSNIVLYRALYAQ